MEVTRSVGRPRVIWRDDVEDGLRSLRIINFKKNALETDQWRGVVDVVKACNRL
jgi:hypothetical protein